MSISVHVVKGQFGSGLQTIHLWKLSLYVKVLGDFFKKKYGSVILWVEKHFGTDLYG